MNAPEAREQLDIVDRILAYADETCGLSPTPFIVWGITGAVLNCVAQLIIFHTAPQSIAILAIAALLAAIVWTIVWVRRLRGSADRQTLLDRQIFVAFTIAWIVALVVQLGAFQIFTQWAQAAIWSVMEGAAMLSVGVLARNRPVLGGGVILLLSVVAANFAVGIPGFLLAIGDLIGMAGAGVLLYAGRR